MLLTMGCKIYSRTYRDRDLSRRVFHYLENTTVSSPHASVLTAINIVRCKLLPFDCHENLSLPSGPLE